MSISPPDQTVGLAAEFCVDIDVAQVTNLGSFEFTLEFPPATLEAESATLGAFLGSSGRTVIPVNPTINNNTGEVVYGAATLGENTPGPNGGGHLARVCFTPKQKGTADLTLTNGVLTDVQGESIAATLQHGSVTVSSCFWADLNCDNKVNVIDIQLVAGHWNTEPGDPGYDPAYDINDNNRIDIIDIQMVAGQWGWSGRAASTAVTDETDAAGASDALTLSLDPSLLDLAVGETKTLDLRVGGAENLAGYETIIDYDPALLEVNSVTFSNFLAGTGRTVTPLGPTIDNAAGTVSFGAFSFGQQPGVSDNGVLATVSVTALAAGSGPLDLRDSIASDPKGVSLALSEVDGSFEVSGGSLVAPVINSISNSDGDGNFMVSWSVVSGATGYSVMEMFNSVGWSEIYSGPNTGVNRAGRASGEWCYLARAYNHIASSAWSQMECVAVSDGPVEAYKLYLPMGVGP